MNGLVAIMTLVFFMLNLKLLSHNILFVQDHRILQEHCPLSLREFLELPPDSSCVIPDLYHRPRKGSRLRAPEAICAILEQAGFSTTMFFYPWTNKPYKGVTCDSP